MASKYTDPRDFVQHIRSELLNEYLKTRHALDFPVGDKKEKSEARADRFMTFLTAQDAAVHDRVLMELEYVNDLSSDGNIKALCDHSPHIDRPGVIERAQNHDERALLAFTHYPDEFDAYHSQANLEELPVKELTLPSVLPIADITAGNQVEQFGEKVQEVYRAALKGEKCKIKTFSSNGHLILRAYLEDLPTRDTGFEGNHLDEKRVRKPVFDVVFIYKPGLNMLGVRALGGKAYVAELQRRFCSHFLGIKDINTDVERYSLASIQDIANLNLVADASHGVERVFVKAVRLKKKAVMDQLILRLGRKDQSVGTQTMSARLQELNLDKNTGWEPDSVEIGVVFKQAGKGRRRQVSVSITPPNTCNLKNRPQDDVVRQLLKDWGISKA